MKELEPIYICIAECGACVNNEDGNFDELMEQVLSEVLQIEELLDKNEAIPTITLNERVLCQEMFGVKISSIFLTKEHEIKIFADADDLKASFFMCKIEELFKVPADGIDGEEDWEDYDGDYRTIDEFAYDEDEMWNSYDIPVYAIPRICQLILDPNDSLDYYEIPESHAINEQNRYLELNDEDTKNINEFVANLHKVMPDGFTIDWDEESVGSPYFEPHPAFGLAMDCVKLRIYPNEADTRGHN